MEEWFCNPIILSEKGPLIGIILALSWHGQHSKIWFQTRWISATFLSPQRQKSPSELPLIFSASGPFGQAGPILLKIFSSLRWTYRRTTDCINSGHPLDSAPIRLRSLLLGVSFFSSLWDHRMMKMYEHDCKVNSIFKILSFASDVGIISSAHTRFQLCYPEPMNKSSLASIQWVSAFKNLSSCRTTSRIYHDCVYSLPCDRADPQIFFRGPTTCVNSSPVQHRYNCPML